jgi:beta-glucosidase
MKKLQALPVLAIIMLIAISCTPEKNIDDYLNPDLSTEVRVKDLISRMTVEEKISQMMDRADSIPRLGVPMYNWWNEGLHGVARSGTATVFPQAIGAAAMFNDSLLFVEATAISDEFRAKYNEYIRNNQRNRYEGLTVWSPNINIFRDPRWGRGQETYGEDPYLTSRLGVAFVKGLQGDHPKYYKTIATPKHFAVHSGPEPLRHEFDVDVSERDFLDTYLPGFEATVVEGKAGSVMSVYNRFRGLSGTGSPLLLTEILRNQWGFEGYVVSDCGAVRDIYEGHKIVSSEAEAAAVALKAGCDLNCGSYYRYLAQALEQGLITENDLDTALTRLFTARFKLGMFDPEDMVPFNKIPFSVNDNPQHRELSKITARESIVLLKNENNILPLSKDMKTIAVVGPNADEPAVMYGNYNGIPSSFVTPLQGIRNKVSGNAEVLYAQGAYIHQAYPLVETIEPQFLESGGKVGLKGEYFDNKNLDGSPIAVRQDSVMRIFFRNTPVEGLVAPNFSVRWTGMLRPPVSGTYELYVRASKGFRLFLDDQPLIDNWEGASPPSQSAEVDLIEGQSFPVRIEYQPDSLRPFLFFQWKTPKIPSEKEALDIAQNADVVVFVGGLSPRLEGEEMRVSFEGFEGGDRTSMDLPASQQELLKKLYATGKPIVFVLMNGSALSINWADANLPAIVEAWYPGQEGGTAIADVLFGDYNPAGRLPVTFYKSVDQLPPFVDYDMEGRTYRFFREEPLYPFGYGLSYSQFEYSNLQVPATIETGQPITISVDVQNTGEYDGDEVVQLYLKHLEATVPVPIHSLQGFKRIHLKKGQKKTIHFTMDPKQVSVIDDEDQRVVVPGKIRLFAGGGQPGGNGLSAEVNLMGEVFDGPLD